MLLALDIGNTNTVLGCFWDAKLKKTWRISTHPICTSDELRLKLHSLLAAEGIQLDAFKQIVVSSVVPQFTAIARQAFAGRPLHVIDHQSPFSFTIKADPASQVGADRLVNAEAAFHEYGVPAIIVDSGTATTLCAVSSDNEYLGGAIMPGIEVSIETLAKKTAKLFSVELIAPATAIGSNTQDALRSGIMLGYSEMIDGMVRRFKAELGWNSSKGCVIATGGISQLLQGLTKEIDRFDPDLTLKGIAHVARALRTR